MAPLSGVFDAADAARPVQLTAPAAGGPALQVALDGRLASPASPAAVLSRGWESRGEAFLADLRGDFAFVLWDTQRRRGLIARDQLGGRSVYMHRAGGRLFFATELRDLLELLPARPAPDRLVLLHWLAGNDPRGTRTLFEGVETLAPGHAVRLAPHGFEVFRWWAPRFERPLRAPRADLVERIRAGVDTAVSRTAGAATGVLMSGGLDSTSVAAVARRRGPVTAYSLVYPTLPSADESAWIDVMARELDMASVRHSVEPTSLLAGAREFIAEWQLPPRPRTFSALLPLLRRAGEDGTEVMLDGEGGDLLFGASPALLADRVRRGRLVAAVRLARRFPGAGENPAWPAVRQLVSTYGIRGALPAGLHGRLRSRGDLARHLAPWIPAADARELVEHAGDWDWKRYDGPRWWAQLAEGVADGLHAIDIRADVRRRGAMAGVDSRSPLLDLDLVELALRLPAELAFDPLLSRLLLREAMTGLVPDPVRLRPDKSFLGEFTRRSLFDHDLPAIQRLLGVSDAELGAYVDMRKVRSELLDTPLERAPHGARFRITSLWRLATAELWLRAQAGRDSTLEPAGVPIEAAR